MCKVLSPRGNRLLPLAMVLKTVDHRKGFREYNRSTLLKTIDLFISPTFKWYEFSMNGFNWSRNTFPIVLRLKTATFQS